MSVADQITIINHAFFNPDRPPDEMHQILSDGTAEIANWEIIAPAIKALDAMPWHTLNDDWRFFLAEERVRDGRRTLTLNPDRVHLYRSRTQELVRDISQPMTVLRAVHPTVPENAIIATVQPADIESLVAALEHIQRVSRFAVDDALTIASLQTGSLEIALIASDLTMRAFEIAIMLSAVWKSPHIREGATKFVRLVRGVNPTTDTSDEELIDQWLEDEKNKIWEAVEQPFREHCISENKNEHEAKSLVDKAAKELAKAEEYNTDWQLPRVTVHGLPYGIKLDFITTPSSLSKVIKELAEPPSNQE